MNLKINTTLKYRTKYSDIINNFIFKWDFFFIRGDIYFLLVLLKTSTFILKHFIINITLYLFCTYNIMFKNYNENLFSRLSYNALYYIY